VKASKAHIGTISRLSTQAVFDCLRQTRDLRWVATGLVLQAAPRMGEGPYGLCVSVSKKTAKLAVNRNRIRRRLKAVAFQILPDIARPGMDYMVSGRHQTLERDSADLDRDLRWCLKKLNLLKDGSEHAETG
jgi:ribonuclease P protein component